MEKKKNVSDAELEILEVLWTAGEPLNTAQIRSMLEENKSWERTTVLTLIQSLVKKGMLHQEKREVYYYSPAVSREAYVKEETKNFVNKFFHGRSEIRTSTLMGDGDRTKKDTKDSRDIRNFRF